MAALAAVVLGAHLGGYALWDPDEARHAEVAREVFTAGTWRGWIVPSLGYRAYYDKPILFYWLVSGAYAIGGVNEAAARSVPGLAAAATALVVHGFARRAWGPLAGVAGAAVLLTAVEFAALGRYVNLDMVLTLWTTLGAVAAYRWACSGSSRAALLAAAAAGFGMLTKGLVAPVLIGGTTVLFLWSSGRVTLVRRLPMVRAALAFGLVAGPWYAAAAVVEPAYLEEFFLRHHAQRFVDAGRLLHGKPLLFYVPILIGGFFPWSLLLPATASATLAWDRRGDPERFCAAWALVVFGFFTLSSGKLGTYILPLFPPLALLTGRMLERVVRGEVGARDLRLLRAGLAGVAAAFLLAVPALLLVGGRFHGGVWSGLAWFALVFAPFAGAVLWWVHAERHALACVAVGAAMVAGFLVFYRWVAPRISDVQSEAGIARTIAAAGPEAAAAPILGYSVRTHSLLFYLRRPARPVDRPAQVARAIAAHPLVFVVTSPRHVPALLAAVRLWPWRTDGHHVLYASSPPPG